MNAHRIQEIVSEALERSDADRERYLTEACNGDQPLRREVESLLDAAGQAGSFMGSPTAGPDVLNISAGAAPLAGSFESCTQSIGPYKLLERIGEGGFGSVWMAEQREPVRRRVALKLGMDTKQVIARFEAERQALAMMDHANIAKVLDAGATDTGRPYFVMELVKGTPITNYCDENHLTVNQRLELLSDVCHAVQHAHQKGVIHRDLKPSNILVAEQDGRPHVKVIDFGIAKATDYKLTDKTLYTEFQQLIGTPAYMSPEPAAASILTPAATSIPSACCSTSCSPARRPSAPALWPADANGDGQADGEDISAFVGFMLAGGSPSEEFCAADMNDDGFITTDDLMPFVTALLAP